MTIVAQYINVSKRFGDITALSNLNLQVSKGQAVALLGPNGAGKTTALSLLLGLRGPSSGTVKLFGQAPGTRAAMARIGVTPQAANFPPQLSPRELLEFATAHFPNPHTVPRLIEDFELTELADRPVRGFSGGQLRRVALALCFAGNPELVILDEPTSGLDAKGQKQFQDYANKFVADGGTLILTSHYWAEIENVADTIVMIDDGITVMNGNIAEIKAAFALNRISFKCDDANDFITANFELDDGYWRQTASNSDELVRQLITSNPHVSNLTIVPRGLEEAIAVYRAQSGQPPA